jgi:hypothetical protein
MQVTYGLVRLSDSSFGLLIYPCSRERLVSEVVLVDVTLAELGVEQSRTVILRERYPEPVDARDLLVSTDPAASVAVPGGRREIVDPELLERFNNDRGYSTELGSLSGVTLEAFSPDGREVSGGGNLGDRFDVDVGSVLVPGLAEVPLSNVRCPEGDEPAWNVTLPQQPPPAAPQD